MKYILIKILCKIFRISDEKTCEWINSSFRKKGMQIGRKCKIYSDIGKGEPFLIDIGNNVTISNDVQIITHDNSIIKLFDDKTDYFGNVAIEDNCFIGAKAIILPGVTVGNNAIVGAGCVVAESVEPYSVVVGNPAKKICDIWQFKEKIAPFCVDYEKIRHSENIRLILEENGQLVKK